MGEGEGGRRGRGAVARGVVERCVAAESACWRQIYEDIRRYMEI